MKTFPAQIQNTSAINEQPNIGAGHVQLLRQGFQTRDRLLNPDGLSEAERKQIIFNGCSPYATAKIPGCVTPKRDDRLDDHVYETIPGDEALYAEFLRLRELGLLPKRLNRIPDHPKHFISYHPPALPARNIENSPHDKSFCLREGKERQIESSPHDKSFVSSHDKSFISAHDKSFRAEDTRNRPPMPPPSHSRCTRQPTTDPPKSRRSMMRSFSWEGQNAFDPDMSTQSVPDKYMTNPGQRSGSVPQNWSPGDEFNYVEGIRQPPPKRRENFYLLLQNKQKRAEISQSLEIETKLKELGLVFDEKLKGKHNIDADGYTTVDDDLLPFEHPRDRGQAFLKSTFV